MNEFGQTICLNMIVKNEAEVIRRCLDSVSWIIDYWVIVDTGSTDNTQQIIREHLKNIPGELHERSWQDFAHNRSEALALARGHGAYVLVIDADEILVREPGFELPQLTSDSYNIQVRYGGCTYQRRQLVNNGLPWRYEGVLHEYMTCEQARSEQMLAGLYTVPFHDGARARSANTYRHDALVLEKALLDDPQNTRYVFYLAQSYRDSGDNELALRHYKRRIEMGGWRDEVWYSLYQVAQIRERMEHPWPEVLDSYLAAWQYQPDRAGPLYRIAMHYQAKREYQLSHLFFSRAMQVTQPDPYRLFVEQTIYDFHLPLEYAVSCFYVGQHEAAIETNNRLLRSAQTPPHAIDQVVRNRRFSLDALFPKVANTSGPARLRVVVPICDPGPELDDCVDSLLRQTCDSFDVVVLDHGSRDDHSTRLPVDDARFSFVNVSGDRRTCIEQYIREQIGPDDIVLVLSPESRLAENETLQHVRTMFEDAGCMLGYGQLRKASGAPGKAEPAPSEQAFLANAANLTDDGPIAFRAQLLQQQPASAESDWNDLFRAAGFAHTRFSDLFWSIETPASKPIGERAPAVLDGKLPTVSCLMVTLDRLTLAKRAICSFATQSYQNRELIIVTDGKESFRQALERYVAALGIERVRFVYAGPKRSTLGKLRNISLDAAQGDIVCQWDDDDYSHPERLVVQTGHMMRNSASACLMTDHLHYIEGERLLCWIDWTVGGTSKGSAQLAPGTILMFRDKRFQYPEDGQFARQGEDAVFLEQVYKTVPVAHLEGAGHLYLYTYHGRNTFPRGHHYHIAKFRTSNAHLHQHADKLREATRHYPIAKPYFVVGREGLAFALN
ncbi:MAG TPA: glycosyltransferase [Pyrinomonadaceae bacterium]|nr:glycosyltransferase [Pyrinomonadaceae bacterium]